MTRKAKRLPWIVRFGHAHLRLVLSVAIGLATFFMPIGDWGPVTRFLIGWDVGVAIYLVAVGVVMSRATPDHIRRRATAEDEGAVALLILSAAAAMASLMAIFAEVAAVDRAQPGYGWHIALAVGTIVLSWAFIHTIFALHYAHEFYSDRLCQQGLEFPGGEPPDYWDFVYFAFVIGMTFQVSDVAVSKKGIRRTVAGHGVLSFLFTTAIVALTVNIAASVIQR